MNVKALRKKLKIENKRRGLCRSNNGFENTTYLTSNTKPNKKPDIINVEDITSEDYVEEVLSYNLDSIFHPHLITNLLYDEWLIRDSKRGSTPPSRYRDAASACGIYDVTQRTVIQTQRVNDIIRMKHRRK
ncbi:hypothetical protein C0J52_26694 [Blattella germanica]|nr:hypothetical protein C0J52_26694 [Blattella germanica]